MNSLFICSSLLKLVAPKVDHCQCFFGNDRVNILAQDWRFVHRPIYRLFASRIAQSMFASAEDEWDGDFVDSLRPTSVAVNGTTNM